MFPTTTCTPSDDLSVSADPATPVAEAALSVSALLKRSRAHHLRKTELANRFRGKTHAPNYPQAEREAAQALTLRLQAHDLDPDHTDPEWANDRVPHDELVAFLTRYEMIP